MTANMPTQLLTMLVQKYSRRTSIISDEKGARWTQDLLGNTKKRQHTLSLVMKLLTSHECHCSHPVQV